MNDSEAPRRAPNADSTWSPRAKRLWLDTFKAIPADEWRTDEIELLRLLCQSHTVLERLDQAILEEPLLMNGSHGGKIANPLLTEARMTRNSILAIQKALNLPAIDELLGDGSGEGALIELVRPMSRSEAGKAGAAGRWSGRALS